MRDESETTDQLKYIFVIVSTPIIPVSAVLLETQGQQWVCRCTNTRKTGTERKKMDPYVIFSSSENLQLLFCTLNFNPKIRRIVSTILFLISSFSAPHSHTDTYKTQSSIFYTHNLRSNHLSCEVEFKYPSGIRLQSIETKDVYSLEVKLLVSFCLLKPSDCSVHHFPPVSRGSSPFLPNKEANKGSDSCVPCADWMERSSFECYAAAAQAMNDTVSFS